MYNVMFWYGDKRYYSNFKHKANLMTLSNEKHLIVKFKCVAVANIFKSNFFLNKNKCLFLLYWKMVGWNRTFKIQ